MLATKENALKQIQSFGLDVQSIEVDTPTPKRVKFSGKQKRNLDGFYQVYSFPGTDLVAGYYGTFYGGKTIEKIKGDDKAYTKLNEAQKFRIRKSFQTTQKQVEDFEPDFSIWDKARACSDHRYLTKKGINVHDGLRVIGQELLIPYYNRKCELVSLQRILPDGKKFLIKGSKPKGAYFTFKGSEVHAICEGFATGATIHEATGWTVIVAFSADNLKHTARNFKAKPLIICGDDDWETEIKIGKNPGRVKANEVAKRYQCLVAFPRFTELNNRGTDFNDLGAEKTKEQLSEYLPKDLLSRIIDAGGKKCREQFIKDHKELIADYPKDEKAFLINRIKDLGISKQYVYDCIAGIKSEEQLQQMEEAKATLKNVRYDGKHYYRIEDNKFYSTTATDITMLLDLAGGPDVELKEKILNDVHCNQMIESVIAQPIPFNKSYIEEFLGAEGKITVIKHVSIMEHLQSCLSKLEDVKLNSEFIEYIKNDYPEMVDITLAGLARKFCEDKKSFVYLQAGSNYGKNFFFEVNSITKQFTNAYTKEDFKGNDPDSFIRPIMIFVEEANKFPSEYKSNQPEYRRIYGGLQTVKLGLRVLACANKMEDLERGLDPQLANRIIVIKPKHKNFDHHGIERTLSQQIWEKFIITLMVDHLEKWNHGDEFFLNAEKHFDAFKSKYQQPNEFIALEEVMRDHLEHLFELMINPNSGKIKEFKGVGGFDFSNHIEWINKDEENELRISSPAKFMKELFAYFEPSRYKAFRNRFCTVEDYKDVPFISSKKKRIGSSFIKGFFILIDFTSSGLLILDR